MKKQSPSYLLFLCTCHPIFYQLLVYSCFWNSKYEFITSPFLTGAYCKHYAAFCFYYLTKSCSCPSVSAGRSLPYYFPQLQTMASCECSKGYLTHLPLIDIRVVSSLSLSSALHSSFLALPRVQSVWLTLVL